ncbi:glycosyltransferase [Erysipelatoclostridium sp. An173]|uniref:glycosyltransferase n=1 Tax=Erysipelatoclostridium sp. An173 TaxID=1965571 RepID=UPI00320A6184
MYHISDIYFILVLYNKNYKDSKAIQCLAKMKDVNVIVVDNSTRNYGNSELEKIINYKYVNMGGNKGLSKAYNKGLEFMNKEHSLVCLLDDDTIIPSEYIQKVLFHINNNQDVDILLPVVKDQNGILSPNILKKYKYCRIDDLSKVTVSNISAINSGMIIKGEIFKNYKYNENLFLDYIDHDFIRSMKKINKKIFVMEDNVLIQDFSVISDSEEKAKLRYSIKRNDLKYFFNNNKLYYYITIFKHKLGLCYFQKSIKPLFW